MNKNTTQKTIVWFRQDLRCKDNPALYSAVEDGQVFPVYILDDTRAAAWKMGAASRVWLHHSLYDLHKNLGKKLHIFHGDPQDILKNLIAAHGITHVYWNRCYEPWRIARDKNIKTDLQNQNQNIEVQSFNASLLWEPWQVKKNDGTPYKVFTPYYTRGCRNTAPPPRTPYQDRDITSSLSETPQTSVTQIDALKLLPTDVPWHEKMLKHWDISEDGAHTQFTTFLENNLCHYKNGRDYPAQQSVSRLSPYLHFGQISPHQLWHATHISAMQNKTETGGAHFARELGWREFSHSLLYHWPHLPHKNFQEKFDRFPWTEDETKLKAWQTGMTGYPIIDAGMRELWQTGYMHNRIRMVVGSFLVKNLGLHWHHGAKWFWDCLFDADLANNSASWQWVAGCGADAAPYFRIFNPITQGEKFDREGVYTRQYVPELKNIPDKYLFQPWKAPEDVLQKANIILGKTYPQPIVDLKPSRERALAAYQKIRVSSE